MIYKYLMAKLKCIIFELLIHLFSKIIESKITINFFIEKSLKVIFKLINLLFIN